MSAYAIGSGGYIAQVANGQGGRSAELRRRLARMQAHMDAIALGGRVIGRAVIVHRRPKELAA